MSVLSSESYVFDPRPNYPLQLAVKRYWKPSSSASSDTYPNAVTFILAHASGYHKEHYEPMIEHLYELLESSNALKIRDVWSIDAPNHGDSAVLNEETLQWGYQPIFRWEEYTRSLHAFLAGLGTGVNVNFAKRNLVCVGHSMGGTSFIILETYEPKVNVQAYVLVEPMLMRNFKQSNFLEEGAAKRRDIWANQEDAFGVLKRRPAFKVWDERVLRIYVNYGLRPLPTADYPDKHEGVTLKCSRYQEAATYRDPLGIATGYRFLSTLVKRAPVHIIYGAIDDYIPMEYREDVLNNASGGIENFASFSTVPGAGHLVVQTHPKDLASYVLKAICTPQRTSRSGLTARL